MEEGITLTNNKTFGIQAYNLEFIQVFRYCKVQKNKHHFTETTIVKEAGKEIYRKQRARPIKVV